MACGSCGKRKRRAGEVPVGVGASSRVMFYSVDPAGNATKHTTLVEARAAARAGGSGWTVEGRREKIEPKE